MGKLIHNKLILIKQENNNTWRLDWYDNTNYSFDDYLNVINEIIDWVDDNTKKSNLTVEIIYQKIDFTGENRLIGGAIKSCAGTHTIFSFDDVEDSMAFKLKFD